MNRKTRNKRRGAAADDNPAGDVTRPSPDGAIRLSKFLSDAGVASRRHAEELILEGHVSLNGQVVDTLPAFVRPGVDEVLVDGTPVRPERPLYWIVHKPKGFVTTNYDPSGRKRALDLLPPDLPRLFPVGRLDIDSSGLLLMTNDGELAQQLTHPRFGIPKVYRVEVAGKTGHGLPDALKRGVYLAEGKATASDVRIVHTTSTKSILEITLREGPNRQVRRMLARVGHPVRRLSRVAIGPVSLKGLPVGAARPLSAREVEQLRRAVAHKAQRDERREKRPSAHVRQDPRKPR